MADAQLRLSVQGARQVTVDLGAVATSVNNVENTVSQSSRGIADDLRRVAGGFNGVGDTMRDLSDENTRTQAGIGMLKGALGALGLQLSISFFKDFIDDTIASTAALKNMAAASGITGAQLSALMAIGDLSGTGADKIVESMNIITEGMAGADEGADGVAAALKTLGVRFDDFKKLEPDQQFFELAKSMNEFKDGTAKVQVAMQLFGEEGGALLPVMRDLAEVHELTATRTNEQIEAAESYQRSMKKLSASHASWKSDLALGILPALHELSNSLLDAYRGTGGLGDEVKRLSADGSLANFARGGITVLTYLGDAVQFVGRLFSGLGKLIGANAAAVSVVAESASGYFSSLKNGNFSAAFDSIKRGWIGVGEITQQTFSDLGELVTSQYLGSKIREGMEQVRVARTEDVKSRKELHIASKASEEDAKKEEGAYQGLLKAIYEKIAGQRAEIESESQLTEGEKLRNKTNDELRTGMLKLSAAHKANIADNLAELISLEKVNLAKISAKKMADDMHAAAAKDLASVVEEVKKEQERRLEIGLTTEQLARLRAQKLLDAAATDDQTAANLREAAIFAGPLREAYLSYAAELDKTAEKKRELSKIRIDNDSLQASAEAAKRIGDEWKKTSEDINASLQDAVMDGFENGFESSKSIAEQFSAYLKNMFKKLVLQPFLAPISNSMASIMNPGAAAQTGGGQTMGLDIGSIFTMMGNGFAGLGDRIAGTTQAVLSKMQMGTFGADVGQVGSFAKYAGMAGQLAVSAYIGKSLGTAISGGYSVGNRGSALVNIGTLLGGPLGGAAAGLFNRAFGMGPKNVTGETLTGTLSNSGLINGATNTSYHQKGGWFRSDKNWTETKGLDASASSQIGDSYKALQAVHSAYAATLGINADAISARTHALNITLTSDAQANEKALNEFFAGVGNAMANELLPSLSAFTAAGETASATFARLANEYQLVDSVVAQLGMRYTESGVASLVARDRLVNLTGGMAAFAQSADFFAQNFLTEQEQLTPTIDNLAKSMQALGFANVTTIEQYSQLVKAQDIATESGAKTYASLMQLAPSFKLVADFNKKTAEEAQEHAERNQEQAQKIAESRANLQIELLEASGRSEEALAAKRELAIAATDVSLREIQREIFAKQDAREAAQALAGINDGIANDIENLVKSSQTLAQRRAKELEASDASTQALLRRKYALEDERTATEAASAKLADWRRQQEDFGAALSSSYERQKTALEGVMEARKKELESIEDLRSSLAMSDKSTLSRDQKYSEAKNALASAGPENLSAAVSAFLDAAKNKARNGTEYATDYARAQIAIETAQNKAETSLFRAQNELNSLPYAIAAFFAAVQKMQGGKVAALPSFDVGSNYLPYDMVAKVHQGEAIIPRADNKRLLKALDSSNDGSNSAMQAEIRQLRQAVDAMAQALGSRLESVIANTGIVAGMQRRWNTEGMPPERAKA